MLDRQAWRVQWAGQGADFLGSEGVPPRLISPSGEARPEVATPHREIVLRLDSLGNRGFRRLTVFCGPPAISGCSGHILRVQQRFYCLFLMHALHSGRKGLDPLPSDLTTEKVRRFACRCVSKRYIPLTARFLEKPRGH